VSLIFSLFIYIGNAQTLSKPYISTTYLTSVPFGWHSHWLQPWRAYLETMPTKRFFNGVGINWNSDEIKNSELVAQMLSKHGLSKARLEIGWGSIDFDTEQLTSQKAIQFKSIIQTFKKYKIRPLIVLNAHQGVPCPVKMFQRTVVKNASAGATKIELSDVNELQVGYSGLSNLTDYWAAEALITQISGNIITLSKPLPNKIDAGTSVAMATLKYRPFSIPGSDDYQKTIEGWKKYVEVVTKLMTDTLETSTLTNKGFDLEIWNELSFGTHFLNINDYYASKPYQYDQDSIWDNLINVTSDYVTTNAAKFEEVDLTNGFSNTIPWTASSKQPPNVIAISKHPYSSTRKNYPQDESSSIKVNALGQEESSGFVPTYSAIFPEYAATALQTETIVRDMAPITSDIYGINHGRLARVIQGKVKPVYVWLSEGNISPIEDAPDITAEKAHFIKAKTASRYTCFYLNKGALQVLLFVAADADEAYGIIPENFIEYSEKSNVTYPSDDSSYTSETLVVLKNLIEKMRQETDVNLSSYRSLEVVSISDSHNHYQFLGDGTAEHSTLYDREVFAFLPFQANSKKFVIPYYVMTRDVMKDLQPEEFTLQIKGINTNQVSVSAYDPMNDTNIPVTVNKTSNKPDSLSITVTAVDYPYLLTIKEG
ncbi:MAG: hypothetical protein RLZZ574_3395, partial [Cyanobacteriota bacterium]